VYFSLPFPAYFTLKTKSEFSPARAEKGVEDIIPNKQPILIKQNTKKLCGVLALKGQGGS